MKNLPRTLIRCSKCRFVRQDEDASELGWKAYECGNRKSPYYKSLVNSSVNGEMLRRITFSGCAYGERGERS